MSKRGFSHESTHNDSIEWYTPPFIFDRLDIEFDMDVASPGKDIVSWIPAKEHLTIKEDGLTTQWNGNIWLNPPYGSDTKLWLKKLATHDNGIALVFARTDTDWFHKYVSLCDMICFIKGRVQFISLSRGSNTKGSGSPSMLIARGGANCKALKDSKLGMCFDINKTIRKDELGL